MKIHNILRVHNYDFSAILICEHCNKTQIITTGYDDCHYHRRVIPAFHCEHCGKNRAGELKSPEVTARNKSMGVYGI